MLTFLAAFSLSMRAQPTPSDGPRYSEGTNLVRPDDYREWPFLGAGLGMTYDPAPGVQSEAPQRFTNVFVNPVVVSQFHTDRRVAGQDDLHSRGP